MDYNTDKCRFWISVIGHEALSVLALIETKKSWSGTKEQIATSLELRTSKLNVLKLLDSFRLISMSRSKAMYTVFATGVDDVPPWGAFVQSLALAVDSGGLNKTDVSTINWSYVFSRVDQETTADVRVGLGKLKTVEVITRADKQAPRVLVNGNQRPNGSGFSFDEVKRGDFVCLCSHFLGSSDGVDVAKPTLKIKLKPSVTEPEMRRSDMWQSKPTEEWTATELSGWIVHRFTEVYGDRPPFNAVEVQRAGILVGGVKQLARLMRVEDHQELNKNFADYVEWLLSHQTFDLTLSALTSSKTMSIFIIDKLKKAKKTVDSTVGIPEGQNLRS